MHPVIAIDGPAASGKSTVAQALADRTGFTYVNTGAMYRALTWKLLQMFGHIPSGEKIAAALAQLRFECRLEGGKTLLWIDGVDPLPHVRSAEVNEKVSAVAASPVVREFLVPRQQALAEQAPLIMEGRDIGTVVFPQTPFKFFLDADPDVRASRRQSQGESDQVQRRDAQDSTRSSSPLKCAEGAERLDSGSLSVDEIVARILCRLGEGGLKMA
jgi:cytidylate kinase